MTRLSESRLSHISHLIVNGLSKAGLVNFPHEGRALQETKLVLHDFFQSEDSLDEVIRQKIASLSRQVPVGSREWDILYRKYSEEEKRKHRK